MVPTEKRGAARINQFWAALGYDAEAREEVVPFKHDSGQPGHSLVVITSNMRSGIPTKRRDDYATNDCADARRVAFSRSLAPRRSASPNGELHAGRGRPASR